MLEKHDEMANCRSWSAAQKELFDLGLPIYYVFAFLILCIFTKLRDCGSFYVQ